MINNQSKPSYDTGNETEVRPDFVQAGKSVPINRIVRSEYKGTPANQAAGNACYLTSRFSRPLPSRSSISTAGSSLI
jgi:hypothetical protein